MGVADGQGDMVCCGSWGREEWGMTEQLNWAELAWNVSLVSLIFLHYPDTKRDQHYPDTKTGQRCYKERKIEINLSHKYRCQNSQEKIGKPFNNVLNL